eukprot:scaffold234998_cov38-Prasinocladus_malaysianus.AAC.1
MTSSFHHCVTFSQLRSKHARADLDHKTLEAMARMTNENYPGRQTIAGTYEEETLHSHARARLVMSE